MTNLDFMNQSALLYSTYHNLRIIVHRSFIPLPHKSSTTSFPSLTICTSAARSCIHILHAIFRRDLIGIYQNLVGFFNSYARQGLNSFGDRAVQFRYRSHPEYLGLQTLGDKHLHRKRYQRCPDGYCHDSSPPAALFHRG